MEAERLSWSQNNEVGAFASPLKWSLAGGRDVNPGMLWDVGTSGHYWSSTVTSTYSRVLSFDNYNAGMYNDLRASGHSVRCIQEIAGVIGALNCNGAIHIGTPISGQAALNVSASVPYIGGNGGFYAAQNVASTGVTGLTAALAAGTLANGNGSVTYTITGTPASSGTASFAITLGGQSCSFAINVAAVQPPYPAGTVHCAGATIVVDVTNPTTGLTWMDRNLGASQVATSSTDQNAYGDLYQWGRRADGHQCRTSPTMGGTLSSVDQPAHGNFIHAPAPPYDWRSPQNTNLWQGVNGVNNPCPSGYRLPTETELNNERLSWGSNNGSGAFAAPLKWTLAGVRLYSNGSLNSVGTHGGYWSSSVSGTSSRYLYFYSSSANMLGHYRAYGFTVRCVKETVGAVGALNCNGVTTSGNLISVPYTGGNGGYYAVQTTASTGVTGLTATLAAGTLANGAGSVTYSITGTPASSGTASFAITLGGQSCSFTINVSSPTAVLATLNCAGATTTGTLSSGSAANVVSTGIPYTGGNAGTYFAQSVASTGVTGLTASLAAGTLANGNGSVTYTITGTPASAGTASFAITLGGQSCSFTINVSSPAAVLATINCAGATTTGTLTSGTAANGESTAISYTGGNAGSYSAQNVASTGVTGLTASLAAGTLANGNGSVTYTITGTPASAGTASFAITLGGQSCSFTINILAHPQYPANSVFCAAGATAIVDVTNPTTGLTWMDRNLGASQVAISSTDQNAYGDLYQWGRRADGHQCRTSLTTYILSSVDQPAHGNFIEINSGNYDWRSPQNTNLWQGVNGVNNPCPSGYRLPTETELNNERLSWGSNNGIGAYAAPLKWTLAGYRGFSNGSLYGVGTDGLYWSSSVSGTSSRYLNFSSSNAYMSVNYRAGGFTVRCIKETFVGSVGALNCAGATTTGTLTSGTAANGVSTAISYTGGNVGTYGAQSVASTGVTGLTASLAAGTLANGNGSVTYTITGTPASAGTATFAISLGGQSCSLNLIVYGVQPQYPANTINCNGNATIVNDVTNPTTGLIWMDRNLGASQVATSSTAQNAYGDLYQWGRRADGHQCRTSSTTGTLSSVDQPAHGNFILAPNAPYDWRSPQNTNLWQGVNGVNNPCPSGYRLPSETELNNERLSWGSNNGAGAFAAPLKWTRAGVRSFSNGSLSNVGTYGYYWSSTVSGAGSRYLRFDSSTALMLDNFRADGFSVRCLKN
jgi:uncharacterized protein (TIGR02145 family)